MPTVLITRQKRMSNALKCEILLWRENTGGTKIELAKALKMSRVSLDKKIDDPEQVRVGEIMTLFKILGTSEDKQLKIYTGA